MWFGCPRPIDLVDQCGLHQHEALRSNAAGLGLHGNFRPKVGRESMRLPKYARYRVSHVPPPLQTGYVQTYTKEEASKLENCRMDTSMHSNVCLNRPTYAVRPRSPVEARYSNVQETLYFMSPSGPRVLERKDCINWNYFEDRGRSVEMRTRGSLGHGTNCRGVVLTRGSERTARRDLLGEEYELLQTSPSGIRRSANSQRTTRADREPVWVNAAISTKK
jgi:hypothetical protein